MAISIDPYTPASVKINLYCKNHKISHATGFFYNHKGSLYVVSNWHVFSGRNTYTGQPNDKKCGAIPDAMETALWKKEKLGNWQRAFAPIVDERGRALWLQHPTGQDIDVAVMRVNEISAQVETHFLPRNDEASDLVFRVSSDVFIVGFPDTVDHQEIYPIWKRGSIASEPQLEVNELPFFLVDTATRRGMSGSPVYLRSFGYGLHENGNISQANGYLTRFVGVYSGRYGADDDLAAHLARVWHRDVIAEIIENGKPGHYKLRDGG